VRAIYPDTVQTFGASRSAEAFDVLPCGFRLKKGTINLTRKSRPRKGFHSFFSRLKDDSGQRSAEEIFAEVPAVFSLRLTVVAVRSASRTLPSPVFSTSGERSLEFRRMSSALPAYYSGLDPFRKIFELGNPILTYHKLGPLPGRVRIKGLYVSQALFSRQLRELRQAGFENGNLQSCAGLRSGRQVSLTFDDGYVNVLRHGVEPLRQNGFKAIQFLVADLLGKCNEWDVPLGEAAEPMMDAAQVREWLAAGHDIGSHTLSHPYLTRLSRREAAEEISASRKKLEDLFGRRIQHFCYPYGDWNEEIRDLVQAAGYETACTTDAGVNTPKESPFALKRFTARYASRNLKALWSRIWRGS
jgi:peptidoglycan/xylan/chitin deacetylase (PgdA/CDA1 family)